METLARLAPAHPAATHATSAALSTHGCLLLGDLIDRAETQSRGTPECPGRPLLAGALLRLLTEDMIQHIAEGLASAEPGNTTYQRDLSVSYERLGALGGTPASGTDGQRWLGYAADIRRGLHRREPRRVDLAEELAVTLYLLATSADETDDTDNPRHEVVDIPAAFEQDGTITPKGVSMLQWARR